MVVFSQENLVGGDNRGKVFMKRKGRLTKCATIPLGQMISVLIRGVKNIKFNLKARGYEIYLVHVVCNPLFDEAEWVAWLLVQISVHAFYNPRAYIRHRISGIRRPLQRKGESCWLS